MRLLRVAEEQWMVPVAHFPMRKTFSAAASQITPTLPPSLHIARFPAPHPHFPTIHTSANAAMLPWWGTRVLTALPTLLLLLLAAVAVVVAVVLPIMRLNKALHKHMHKDKVPTATTTATTITTVTNTQLPCPV